MRNDKARLIHDVWASCRIAEGWKYGEKRDDNLKTHPLLRPFDELPESEKDYDKLKALIDQSRIQQTPQNK